MPIQLSRTDDFNTAVTSVGNLVEVMFVFNAVVEHPITADSDHAFDAADAFNIV